MKICVFSRSIPVHSSGGMENHCWTVCLGFSKKGHNVKLITTGHPQGKEYEKINSNFEIFYLEGTRPGKYSKKWWKKSLQKFLELDRTEKFDVVFSESSGALEVLKYKIKHRLSLPIIFRMPGTSIRDAISKLNQRISIKNIMSAIKSYIVSFIDKKWIKYTDSVITCSDEVTNSVINDFNVPEEKVYTILNGVDTELFKPEIYVRHSKENLGIPSDHKLITCVTRLKQEKGVDLLLNAFRDILKQEKNIFLLIAGSGDYENKLKQITKDFNIEDKVRFVGNVSHENIPPYYVIGDIFVFPTLAKEGLPWVVLEAMACRKPVIASKIGGIPQIINDGENGLLFESGKIQELKEKIIELLKDEELRKRLSENARQTIIKDFSQEKMIEQTLGVISKCLKKI